MNTEERAVEMNGLQVHHGSPNTNKHTFTPRGNFCPAHRQCLHSCAHRELTDMIMPEKNKSHSLNDIVFFLLLPSDT